MSVDINLKRNIMRRVFFVYTLKKLASPFWVKVYIMGIFGWQILANVSIVNVIENAPWLNVSGNISFFSYAFMHTGFLVQTLLVGTVFTLAWVCKDFIVRKNGTQNLFGNLGSKI